MPTVRGRCWSKWLLLLDACNQLLKLLKPHVQQPAVGWPARDSSLPRIHKRFQESSSRFIYTHISLAYTTFCILIQGASPTCTAPGSKHADITVSEDPPAMSAGVLPLPCRCTHSTVRRQRPSLAARAQAGGNGPPNTTEDGPSAATSPRGKSGPRKAQEAPKAAKQPRPLPEVGKATWPERQLLPDGWERMDASRKATELWLGKRGGLFWLNKLALWSVIGVAGGWFVFRFVGPALGLYELKESITAPPNL